MLKIKFDADKKSIIKEKTVIENNLEADEIASLHFNLAGVTGSAEASNFYYAFEKGDEVTLDFSMSNKKGTNVIKVSSYPDGNILYSNQEFAALSDLKLKIPKRSVYRFSFATNHAFERNCELKLKRKPVNQAAINFPTEVGWKNVMDTTFEERAEIEYKAIHVQKPIKHYVNSGSNAAFKGGKSRISLPVDLPQNTVKWYYIVSANRNEDEIKSTMGAMDLLGEISKALDNTGTIAFGLNLLSQPPGANYCDAYLLTYDNLNY